LPAILQYAAHFSQFVTLLKAYSGATIAFVNKFAAGRF
jgi:hypothetical protein